MNRYLFPRSGFVLAILITMQLSQVACLAQFAPIPAGIGEFGSPATKLPVSKNLEQARFALKSVSGAAGGSI